MIPELQCLIRMVGTPQAYHHHVLLTKLDGAKWVALDCDGDIAIDGLSQEECIPLTAGMAPPAGGRRFRMFEGLGDAALARARSEASA